MKPSSYATDELLLSSLRMMTAVVPLSIVISVHSFHLFSPVTQQIPQYVLLVHQGGRSH